MSKPPETDPLPEGANEAWYQLVSWYCARIEFDECNHTELVGTQVFAVPASESGMDDDSAAVEKVRQNAPQCPDHGDTMIPVLYRMDEAPPTLSSSQN